MNKTIATTLLLLASGLTLSTTALAEPFNHGTGYINSISNVYSNANTRSVQRVRHFNTITETSGFNDQTSHAKIPVNSNSVVEPFIPQMFSIITHGFNDRS
ncbi:MAG: hypothetical protein H6975_04695 [Gammaproteobacteria bacterium]|nr:hypothetical protein [Gammaproteobacteria bacterium]